jgi:hypothetical protein
MVGSGAGGRVSISDALATGVAVDPDPSGLATGEGLVVATLHEATAQASSTDTAQPVMRSRRLRREPGPRST